MATQELTIILKTVDQATAGLTSVQKGVEDTTKSTMTMNTEWLKWGAIAAGATLAVKSVWGALSGLVDASTSEARVVNVLTTTLANQGIAWANVKGEITTYASKLQQTTEYSDDQVMSTLTRLMQGGMRYKDAMASVNTVLDLSAARQMDVTQASDLLAKAYQGNIGMLARYGITIKEGKDQHETYQRVLDAVSKTMGGTATEAANTLAGQFAILHNNTEDLKQMMGDKLQPALFGITKGLNAQAIELQQLEERYHFFQGTVELMVTLGVGMKNVFEQVAIRIDTVAAALVALFDPTISVNDALKAGADMAKEATEANGKLLKSLLNIEGAQRATTKAVRDHIPALMDLSQREAKEFDAHVKRQQAVLDWAKYVADTQISYIGAVGDATIAIGNYSASVALKQFGVVIKGVEAAANALMNSNPILAVLGVVTSLFNTATASNALGEGNKQLDALLKQKGASDIGVAPAGSMGGGSGSGTPPILARMVNGKIMSGGTPNVILTNNGIMTGDPETLRIAFRKMMAEYQGTTPGLAFGAT